MLAIGKHWRQIGFLACALTLEFTVFLLSTLLVDRMRPQVPRLDVTPPTSSYPSGHTAAAIALYVGLAIVIWSLVRSTAIRTIAWTSRSPCPIFVGISRLYRGMHHLTDVLASVLLGCGALLFALLATRSAVAVSEERDGVRPGAAARGLARGRLMTSVGVIAHSRKELGGGLGALRDALEEHGVDRPLWREVPKSKFAPKEVAKLLDAGVDLLFVWGGDGMVQRCVDAIGAAPVTLAILPAGTANLFASNLGIPHDLAKAVRIGFAEGGALDVGVVNGERFAVMAGTGVDALMIREADAGLKDKLGRFGYVITGVKAARHDPVRARVEVDGRRWFKGRASAVLVGNMGDVIGGISAFPEARPDDGRLNVGVVTADGLLDWARVLGKTAVGHTASSPFVETTTATKIVVELDTKMPYELDGGDRPRPNGSSSGSSRPRSRSAFRRGRNDEHGHLVPETWQLTDDDAKETLARTDRTELVKDAFTRLRYSDGFSHARSMAFLTSLVFVQGVIAAVGIASAIGAGTVSRGDRDGAADDRARPAGRILTDAVDQAHQAGSSGHWFAIAFGTVGALITGTTLMGQIERALNRLYGVERDRTTFAKYGRAFVLALTAGTLAVLAFAGLALGSAIAASIGGSTARTIWNVVRWPIGIALLVAATALIFRWAPRRRQPAGRGSRSARSWPSDCSRSSPSRSTSSSSSARRSARPTDPLAGLVALAFWSFFSALAVLMGAALAAQLEAVRAGAATPDSAREGRSSPSPDPAVPTATVPCRDG